MRIGQSISHNIHWVGTNRLILTIGKIIGFCRSTNYSFPPTLSLCIVRLTSPCLIGAMLSNTEGYVLVHLKSSVVSMHCIRVCISFVLVQLLSLNCFFLFVFFVLSCIASGVCCIRGRITPILYASTR